MFEIIISFSFLIFSFYFIIFFQKRCSKIDRERPPLIDILHIDKLDISKYYQMTDIIITLYIALLLYYHQQIHVFFIRLALIQILRAISFSITILPKCSKNPDKDNERTCTQILLDYFTLKDPHTGHNNDLLFSGHASFSFLIWLYFYEGNTFSPQILFSLLLINIINSFLIVISRCHYSIDVFHAYPITYMVHDFTRFLISN